MSIFGNFGANTAGTNNTNTTGGLFGAQSTNQNATGSSLFGAANTNANPNPLQSQPTQPSLFGASNAANTGGGLFGSTNTSQPATGTTSGGLFGSNTNQPTASGGGLFGTQAASATGGSLFGGTSNAAGANTNTGATGGLFGNTTTAAGGGNLFGNAAQATQQGLNNPLFGGPGNASTTTTTPAAGTGGLFGSGSTTTNTNSGLFGTNTNASQTTGGGLFGANTAAQQPAQATAGTGGSLFGTSTNTQPAAQTTGSIFGGGQASGSGLFGAKPGGLFGSTTTPQQQQQQQPQQQSLFGSTSGNLFGGNTSTLGTSALGGPAQSNAGLGASTLTAPNSLLASRAAASQQQSADPQVQYAYLSAKIEGIYNAWNPASKECRFQHNFYNLVDPKQVNLYGRPPNATNDALWERAVRENPNPSCLVPVIGIGFDDLRSRIDAQTAQSNSHVQKINDLQQRLGALRTQHAVNNASRLLRAASTQTQLAQRIMRFVQHLHLLIPAIRSSALRPEEEALRGRLEELEEEMRRGRVRGRLNELWSLIGAVGASMERAGNSGSQGEWAVVDEDGLAQIAQILAEQQAGLQLLTKIAQKAQKDLNVIDGKDKMNELGEEGGLSMSEGGEALWGSTSTMRESSLR